MRVIDVDVAVTEVIGERIHVIGDTGILRLSGVAAAGIVVSGGGRAYVAGHSEGLVVGPRGHVELTGSCHGAAVNQGGYLRIDGSMDGPVLGHKGQIIVGPHAVFVCSTMIMAIRWPAMSPGRRHDTNPTIARSVELADASRQRRQ